MYVAKTTNLFNRLSKYFNDKYINDMSSKMAICQSIKKYGYTPFHFYILEECDNSVTRILLAQKEYDWFKKINPSYNIQDILIPTYNKYTNWSIISQETKNKISKTLTGRKLTHNTISNLSKGAHKTPVYCYDFMIRNFVTEFEGLRIMARELGLSGTILMSRKIQSGKPFNTVFKNRSVSWFVYKIKIN